MYKITQAENLMPWCKLWGSIYRVRWNTYRKKFITVKENLLEAKKNGYLPYNLINVGDVRFDLKNPSAYLEMTICFSLRFTFRRNYSGWLLNVL